MTSVTTEESPLVERPMSRGKALVFISHDSRDAELAEAFANLLSDVSGGTLKSFRSSDKKAGSGLEFGSEWYKAIMSQLGDATDVVALLTSQSIDRPWILYEAGVAKGKLDSNVLGVALGVPLETVSSGPFGQFQNCGDDADSLTNLVMQLLARNPEASPREEAVRRQVMAFIQEINKHLEGATKRVAKIETDDGAIAKLFEEVKAMVRDLPSRIDRSSPAYTPRTRFRGARRFDPRVLEPVFADISFRSDRFSRAALWLIFLSEFKDDLPWVYEIGLEFYRVLLEGSFEQIEKTGRQLERLFEITVYGPLMVMDFRSGLEMEEIEHLMRYLMELVSRLTMWSAQSLEHRRAVKSSTSTISGGAAPKI